MYILKILFEEIVPLMLIVCVKIAVVVKVVSGE